MVRKIFTSEEDSVSFSGFLSTVHHITTIKPYTPVCFILKNNKKIEKDIKTLSVTLPLLPLATQPGQSAEQNLNVAIWGRGYGHGPF